MSGKRLTFQYNKVILKDPEQFQERMAALEETLETQFKETHPKYCWNYPTALGWLELQYNDVLDGFKTTEHSEVLCEYVDGYGTEMIVRIANRISDSRVPKRLPSSEPQPPIAG